MYAHLRVNDLRAVEEQLTLHPQKYLTIKDIMRATKRDRDTVTRALGELENVGRVVVGLTSEGYHKVKIVQ